MSVTDRGAADWVQSELDALHRMKPKLGAAPQLEGFQREAVQLMADALNTGPWNLPISWEKTQWRCGQGVRFTLRSRCGLATYDFDHLTRLVVLAHDRCVRVDLEPASRGYFYVYLHRRGRDGGMCDRHPTLDEAAARVRGEAVA